MQELLGWIAEWCRPPSARQRRESRVEVERTWQDSVDSTRRDAAISTQLEGRRQAMTRYLHVLNGSLPRTKSTSFIGLGRMGYEMAYNLFSKRYKQEQLEDIRFVVCDTLSETANRFRQSFISQFPDAKMEIVNTPEE